ncbi:MAG: histidinol-phosphatase [Cellulomonadaceae bacterium]|jgi:histidinol-phosphatase|nr:histidinol-phosphatase [Cellulomonadaceae bacterium]
MTDFSSDLALALELADIADALTGSYFGKPDLSISQKADLTPVSEADRAVEAALRARLAQARPDDAVLGEEYGRTAGGARCWIIDPIDGTKNYIRGLPVWATLIGLAVGDDMVVGVVSAPALGRRWWAAQGQGAWVTARNSAPQADPLAPRRIHVSSIDTVAEASLSYASLGAWKQHGLLDEFVSLTLECGRTRGYGDFWSYMLVAEGCVDIAVEPELEIYDMAALVPIVTEAGGVFTSLNGTPGPWGGNALATNPQLYSKVRNRLQAT